MIDVKELTDSDGKLKDGYHLNPDFTTDEYEEEPWDLYNTEDCLKELKRKAAKSIMNQILIQKLIRLMRQKNLLVWD